LAKAASAQNTTSLPSFCRHSVSGNRSSFQSCALWALPGRNFAAKQSPGLPNRNSGWRQTDPKYPL
jgi:hypothetical protein